jgi:hypothetical protein
VEASKSQPYGPPRPVTGIAAHFKYFHWNFFPYINRAYTYIYRIIEKYKRYFLRHSWVVHETVAFCQIMGFLQINLISEIHRPENTILGDAL